VCTCSDSGENETRLARLYLRTAHQNGCVLPDAINVRSVERVQVVQRIKTIICQYDFEVLPAHLLIVYQQDGTRSVGKDVSANDQPAVGSRLRSTWATQ
jgi:hypothetical protein